MKELLLFMVVSIVLFSGGRWQKQKVCVIAFYNLENLYDTIDNPIINDDDFTPGGSKRYTSGIYLDKLKKLATVISMIGNEITTDGPALLGVAEIENDTVLHDLTQQAQIFHRQYRFIHFDSRDARGIDVALLYRPDYFIPEKAEKMYVELPEHSKEAHFTRDILCVTGNLLGERVHILVNHWPSRRGGEERSTPARVAAARVCKKKIAEILSIEPQGKILVMGDLNDDPTSVSVKNVLGAKERLTETKPGELYNPWAAMYKKGMGTLANRDSWGLFDQILVSQGWLSSQQKGLYYHKSLIFNPNFLKEDRGSYAGYPMRTWDGNSYRGGYSDHFPTYIILLKFIN